MWAAPPDGVEADPQSDRRSVKALLISRGNPANPGGRVRLRAVVDLFRGGIAGNLGFQLREGGLPGQCSPDLFGGDQDECFELVKGEIGEETSVIDVVPESPFEIGDAIVTGAPLREARLTREIVRQCVEVDHGGHRRHSTITEEKLEVTSDLLFIAR